MPRNYLAYDFYRFNADGVQKRFFRTGRTTPWSRLESAQTVLNTAQKRWQTILVFSDGLRVKLTAGRVPFSSSGQERFAGILALVCAHAPTGAAIDETTRDIATWGTRDVRRMTKRGGATLPDADTLYARAANQRAWLEHKQALKTVRQALVMNPRHDQALALCVVLLGETGASPAIIFAAADDWAKACPANAEAVLTRLRAGVLAQDSQVVEQAATALLTPPLDPALTFILADHYFRESRYASAATVLDRLADTTEDDAVRGAAVMRRDYVNRYASQAGFRRTEKVKTVWRYFLAWLPLAVMIGFYGWRAYEAWHPREPEPDPWLEQQRAEMARQMEKMNREIQELTGRIIASDEELRRRAEAGEAAAQYTLGSDLLKQTDQELRMREGMALLEAAAAQDYRWALQDLGVYLLAGEYVAKDPARALECFERAAELGSPRAALFAGEMYRKGEDIAADPGKALAWFEQSAAGGNRDGAAMAGWAYESGSGVTVDYEKALNYYLQAAAQGHQWAQERAAEVLFNPKNPAQNMEEAMKWMRRGAEEGSNRMRMFEMRMLLQGLDLKPEERGNIIAWNNAIADTDDVYAPYAAYDLGHYYWSAAHEPFNLQAGLRYFEMAAQRDMLGAIFMIAHCKTFGIGLPRDVAGARLLSDKLTEMAKSNPEATEKMIRLLDRELVAAEAEIPAEAKARSTIYRSPPTYPINLRRAGVEGEALVDFEVGVDGFVSRVDIIRATHPEFGAAAWLAVSAWRLVPKRENGHFVPTHMQVPIVFGLNDNPPDKPAATEP